MKNKDPYEEFYGTPEEWRKLQEKEERDRAEFSSPPHEAQALLREALPTDGVLCVRKKIKRFKSPSRAREATSASRPLGQIRNMRSLVFQERCSSDSAQRTKSTITRMTPTLSSNVTWVQKVGGFAGRDQVVRGRRLPRRWGSSLTRSGVSETPSQSSSMTRVAGNRKRCQTV